MRENEAVVILSYANTPEKLEILEECISTSIENGYKVILSSSYHVPEELQKKVDYLIFDKENPVISGDELSKIGGAIFFWLRYSHFENAHCVDMNHSYAVLKLMKNAASIAKINKIEKLHYLNYDYIIQDKKLLENHSNSLNENDLYYYYYTENENYMNTGIFSIKTNKMIDCFNHINSKSDYCDQGYPILEEYMLRRFRDCYLKIDRDLLVNIKYKNKIDLIATSDFLIQKKIDNKEYNLFVYLSKEQTTGKYYLITKSDILTKMFVKISNEVYSIELTEFPKLFEIDEQLLNIGIEISVPEFKHTEILNRDKKLSSCNIMDYSIIGDLKNIEKSMNYEIIEETVEKKEEYKLDSFYQLSIKNQTDKVYYHGYHFFYPQYFEQFRLDEFKMLEIGYGDGASMKTWIDYFPSADITIMDINVELDNSNRCRVIKGDQSKISDLNRVIEKIGSTKLIIDDGSHNPIHQFNTFNHLFEKLLEPGGIYIIEDIEVSYWNPKSSLYGYESGHFNLIDSFKKYQEMINSEFTGIKNYLNISSITFGQNCIIITKRTEEQKNYFDRVYRFNGCVDNICHFGQPDKEESVNINIHDESLHEIAIIKKI